LSDQEFLPGASGEHSLDGDHLGRLQSCRDVAAEGGGHSIVRTAIGRRLHGQTPDVQLMAVGDVGVDGLGRDAWHQWLTADGGIMLCPLPGTDVFQVQASHELGPDRTPLEPTLETFQQTFDRIAGVPGVRLHDLAWRSTYRVNVRMVDQLRVGRVFLAGDAAHVHPIAGGLGMNNAVQDAYNLGWKLGLVLAGTASPDLLDTYDEERLPIASWTLNITSDLLDAVLAAIKESGGGLDAVASAELTQLQLGYRWSRLSRNAASRSTGPRPGDRHRTRRCSTRPPARQRACSTCSADPISPCSASANTPPRQSTNSGPTS
jgi:2-polyprenyl-6-methoxyphenol hydroxylase-like FAD-dependent oxidoreductase